MLVLVCVFVMVAKIMLLITLAGIVNIVAMNVLLVIAEMSSLDGLPPDKQQTLSLSSKLWWERRRSKETKSKMASSSSATTSRMLKKKKTTILEREEKLNINYYYYTTTPTMNISYQYCIHQHCMRLLLIGCWVVMWSTILITVRITYKLFTKKEHYLCFSLNCIIKKKKI